MCLWLHIIKIELFHLGIQRKFSELLKSVPLIGAKPRSMYIASQLRIKALCYVYMYSKILMEPVRGSFKSTYC